MYKQCLEAIARVLLSDFKKSVLVIVKNCYETEEYPDSDLSEGP